MPATEILTMLERLNHAFPDKRLTKPTLRQVAHQLAGSTYFTSMQPYGNDFLPLEAFQLENDYFHKAEFDRPTWDKLAGKLDRVGHSCRADALRNQAQHTQECEAAYQKGEEHPPRPHRLRYAEWDTQSCA